MPAQPGPQSAQGALPCQTSPTSSATGPKTSRSRPPSSCPCWPAAWGTASPWARACHPSPRRSMWSRPCAGPCAIPRPPASIPSSPACTNCAGPWPTVWSRKRDWPSIRKPRSPSPWAAWRRFCARCCACATGATRSSCPSPTTPPMWSRCCWPRPCQFSCRFAARTGGSIPRPWPPRSPPAPRPSSSIPPTTRPGPCSPATTCWLWPPWPSATGSTSSATIPTTPWPTTSRPFPWPACRNCATGWWPWAAFPSASP